MRRKSALISTSSGKSRLGFWLENRTSFLNNKKKKESALSAKNNCKQCILPFCNQPRDLAP